MSDGGAKSRNLSPPIAQAWKEGSACFVNRHRFAPPTFEDNGILSSVAFGDTVLTSRYECQPTRYRDLADRHLASTGARSATPATEEVPGGVFGSIPHLPRMQSFFCVDGWGAAVLPGEGTHQYSRTMPRMPIEPQSAPWPRGPRSNRGHLCRVRSNDDGAVRAEERKSRLLLSLF